LNVTDRIRLRIALPDASAAVVERWKAHIAAQVLATEIEIAALADGDAGATGTDGVFTARGELSDGDGVVAQVQRVL
jgi:hypothetical protein